MTAAQSANSDAMDGHYETALNELENNNAVRAIWAKAFAESDGDESKAKARYVKYRAEILKAEAAAQAVTKRVSAEPTAEASAEKPAESVQLLYAATIGDKNTAYYLEKFAQFDQQGPGLKVSWNWAAFFGSGIWALYRKMYGWFCIYLLLVTLAMARGVALHLDFVGVIWVMLFVAFTIYANSLYHNSVKKRIAVAQLTTMGKSKLHELLGNKGGVHAWVAWASGLIPIIGIVAAIALPAYQNRQKRSAAISYEKSAGYKTEAAAPAFDWSTAKDICSGPYNPATWANCVGELTTSTGDKYVGGFQNGKFHGQGTYTWANGGRFVGEFNDGKRHGNGIEYRADGSIMQSGIWENDVYTSAYRFEDKPDFSKYGTPVK